MTVRELIEKLKDADPAALVVYWPDTHESCGYASAGSVEKVWVKPSDGEMDYVREPKPGYVPAVEIV